jgi:hypothetical protein
MDFFEALIAISVVVILPITLLKLLLDYKRERIAAEQGHRDASSALTLGELKDIMRQIAEESTEPLAARLDTLERGIPDADLPLLREDPEITATAERTMGRRTT